ncbi:CvpA family protein [Fluviicola sp.]|jgi:membrane protein required for colicin V production|uniref:CvpA family protein n=1 Tax=Fluviicola sp. TaxID=1917219 RepID=UPI0028282902|nr:CvpA family protein [Fluviicola sp.]MDR0803378.1 CvpA family protein [Fluviicola sp.]
MNFLDILILIPVLYGAYKGFKHGFVIELFTLLAILVGIYVGIHFSDYTANWLKASFHWDSEYLPVVAFTLTFLGVGAVVYFGGKMVEKMIKVVQLSPLNKFLGVLFAVIKSLYIVSVLLVLVESYDEKSNFFPKKTKANSLFYEPVKNISTKTVPALGESTIFLKNALHSETDSTGLTVDQVLRAKEIADSLGLDAGDARQILEIHRKYGEKDQAPKP